jgi:hypothetical protein
MKRSIGVVIAVLFLGMIVSAIAKDPILELKEKIIDLQNQGELGFREFTLCSNIIGYGQFVPYPDNKVKAGSEVYFYYEPVNIFTNRRSNTYQLWFTQDMIVLAENGDELLRANEALNFNYQTTSPVLDIFAKNTLTLGNLPSGKYKFIAVIHDKLKNTEAKHVYDFEIVPK